MIYVVKHIEIEGPGIVGDILQGEGFTLRTIELSKGEALPELERDTEAVIVLGGPMNVYEEDIYPYLRDEDVFINKVLAKKIPFLGICLGAQLLAKALGSSVGKAESKEIGWFDVEFTEEGVEDPFFRGLGRELMVFQWHGDTFDLPEGAVLLATARTCKNQAFRAGENAYGIQFHSEVDGNMIEDWIREYSKEMDIKAGVEDRQMITKYYESEKDLVKHAEMMSRNFIKLIKRSKKL